jgi:hypothetical protein
MDVESGKYETNGQLYISLELVPMEQAESSPVGLGRSEPNTAPYLPPPAGRLKIGLDPCSILCALFAVSFIVFVSSLLFYSESKNKITVLFNMFVQEYPGIVCCICCCCCAIILLGVMMVGSTYISGFAALASF